MDIKDLNKSQLIMLALLLSFVTSIATGIVTVTLMQQAPSSIIAPINKVVRETVEKIVQMPGNNTVQTVVIKEEDLVVDAISKNISAVFAISRDGITEEGTPIEVTAGKGFAVSNDGILVVDSALVSLGQSIYAKNDSGKFKATFLSSNKNGFSFIKLGEAVDGKAVLAYTVPELGDFSKMKAGQSIIMVGNTVSSFLFDGSQDLKLNITKSNAGSMILNLNGDVIGIALYSDASSFASVDLIKEALAAKSTDTTDTIKTE